MVGRFVGGIGLFPAVSTRPAFRIFSLARSDYMDRIFQKIPYFVYHVLQFFDGVVLQFRLGQK
jgi:hypothetical protein